LRGFKITPKLFVVVLKKGSKAADGDELKGDRRLIDCWHRAQRSTRFAPRSTTAVEIQTHY
jgi:hypothetical protein